MGLYNLLSCSLGFPRLPLTRFSVFFPSIFSVTLCRRFFVIAIIITQSTYADTASYRTVSVLLILAASDRVSHDRFETLNCYKCVFDFFSLLLLPSSLPLYEVCDRIITVFRLAYRNKNVYVAIIK